MLYQGSSSSDLFAAQEEEWVRLIERSDVIAEAHRNNPNEPLDQANKQLHDVWVLLKETSQHKNKDLEGWMVSDLEEILPSILSKGIEKGDFSAVADYLDKWPPFNKESLGYILYSAVANNAPQKLRKKLCKLTGALDNALFYAVDDTDNLPVIIKLLEYGANPLCVDDHSKVSALYIAVHQQNLPLLKAVYRHSKHLTPTWREYQILLFELPNLVHSELLSEWGKLSESMAKIDLECGMGYKGRLLDCLINRHGDNFEVMQWLYSKVQLISGIQEDIIVLALEKDQNAAIRVFTGNRIQYAMDYNGLLVVAAEQGWHTVARHMAEQKNDSLSPDAINEAYKTSTSKASMLTKFFNKLFDDSSTTIFGILYKQVQSQGLQIQSDQGPSCSRPGIG